MWGFGGRCYWGMKERRGRRSDGIVVVFAWMSSQERQLKSYVELYSSLGWNSLVCHSEFLSMFLSEKAANLAHDLLKELVQELKVRPCPVAFASFSGGPKSCMYKVLQMILGMSDTRINADDLQLVKECLSGHIYDSSPVDFTLDLGARFAVHPTVLRMSHPPRVASMVANGIASGIDTLFLSRFETQRAEYWQTLYSSTITRAPYLILYSENDDLAPYQVICNFAQRLQGLGSDVKLVKFNGSPHLGHYRHYPVDYKAVVTELLGKSAAVYSQRVHRAVGEKIDSVGSHDDVSGPFSTLKKAARISNQNHLETPLMLSDRFIMPSETGYYEGRGVGSVPDEHKEDLIHLRDPPRINANGVLGQFLFDVRVPKNVVEWEIEPSSSSIRHSYSSSRRHTPFNPIKCMFRSRL